MLIKQMKNYQSFKHVIMLSLAIVCAFFTASFTIKSFSKLNHQPLNTDTEIHCSNDSENTATEVSDTNNPISYNSWGAEKMGVDKYIQYLKDLIDAKNNEYNELPEVVVAVLDTGIDTDHPWFKDRLLVDENGKYIGKDYTGQASPTEYAFEDQFGHGTSCAGIICDLTLPNVKILPVKVMSGRNTDPFLNTYKAIDYVIEMSKLYNIVAVNMSLRAESTILDGFFALQVQRLYNAGIFSIAGAGNDNTDITYTIPANVESAITVTALKSDLTKADYSNYGDLVDVCAPGHSIQTAKLGGGIRFQDGTSSAAPHVSAYLALLKSDPSKNYTMRNINDIFSGNYQGIKTTQDLGSYGRDIYFGHGMPILNNLIPNYATMNFITGEHGSISPSGLHLYTEQNKEIVVQFTLDKNCYVYGVFLDGKKLPNSSHVKKYKFVNIKGKHKIEVEFGAAYVVKHYWEPIYDLDNPDKIPEYSQYKLHQCETKYGRFYSSTEAKSKNYPGLTPMEIQQQVIKEKTVVNVYYKRNIYTVTLKLPTNGIDSVVGAGKYLYGEKFNLDSCVQSDYDWVAWKIEYCNDNNFLKAFDSSQQQQSIAMSASDLTITAAVSEKTSWQSVVLWGSGVIFLIIILMVITRPRKRNKN